MSEATEYETADILEAWCLICDYRTQDHSTMDLWNGYGDCPNHDGTEQHTQWTAFDGTITITRTTVDGESSDEEERRLVSPIGGRSYSDLWFFGDLAEAKTMMGADDHLTVSENADGGFSGTLWLDDDEQAEATGATPEEVERRLFGQFVSCIDFNNIDNGDELLARLQNKEG